MKAGAKRLYFDGGKLQIIHPHSLGWIFLFDELRDNIAHSHGEYISASSILDPESSSERVQSGGGNDRARWVFLPLHFLWDWLYFFVLHCNTTLCPQYLSKRKKQIQSLSPSEQRGISMRHFAIRHTEMDWIRVSSSDSLSDHTMMVIWVYDSEN